MQTPSQLRRRLIAWARALPGELLYERRFRLDTTTQEWLPEHGGDQGHYQAVTWRQIDPWLPRDVVGPDDVLLEVGCGKGRLVFLAARKYRFRRIIGIELSPQLVAIAQGNIERNRRRLRCKDVQIVQADARVWPIPDDVTVVTLYNPFIGEVFRGFLEQLLASFERRPRPIRVVYLNALEQRTIEATGRFRLLASDGVDDAAPPDPAAARPTLRWAGMRVYELGSATAG